MLIAELMSGGLFTVQASASIERAAQLMRDHDIGMLAVQDSRGTLCGVITDRDITCRAVAEGKSCDERTDSCMSPDPIFCYADDDLFQAVELMAQQQLRRLLVRNRDQQPVGVIAQADVAQAIASYGLAAEMLAAISRPGGKHTQR